MVFRPEVFPAYSEKVAFRIEFFGDEIDRVSRINTVTGDITENLSYAAIFPATHYAVSDEKREAALEEIEKEAACFKTSDLAINGGTLKKLGFDIDGAVIKTNDFVNA